MNMPIENTYSNKYMEFINERAECVRFKRMFPDAIENVEPLYIKMFQLMDIASEKQIPCVLKDIINSIPGMNELIGKMMNDDNDDNDDNDGTMQEDFDCIIAEMQEDVDLILEHGFPAFEEKLINMFVKIEDEDKQFKYLMEKLTRLSKEISTQMKMNAPTL